MLLKSKKKFFFLQLVRKNWVKNKVGQSDESYQSIFFQVIFQSFKDYFHLKSIAFSFSAVFHLISHVFFYLINDLLLILLGDCFFILPESFSFVTVNPDNGDFLSYFSSWDTFNLKIGYLLSNDIFQLIGKVAISSSFAMLNQDFSHFNSSLKKYIIRNHI